MDDPWVGVRLGIAELLNAVLAWEGGPSSPHWPLLRPPLARLARAAQRVDDDGRSPRPADPELRVALLHAAEAATYACGYLNGPGRQRDVAHAAAVLNTALWKIPKDEFKTDPVTDHHADR